jgi:hypothetical protein
MIRFTCTHGINLINTINDADWLPDKKHIAIEQEVFYK